MFGFTAPVRLFSGLISLFSGGFPKKIILL